MKQVKYYSLLLLMAMALFGCSDYDDTELRGDMKELKSRVDQLEALCATTNSQIAALQRLTEALNNQNYVTGVNPFMEGGQETGYTITFSDGSVITILNGKDGAKGEQGESGTTPIIGVKQDTDGFYYWTIKIGDAESTWLTDSQGQKIRTTGDQGAQGDKGDKGDKGDPGEIGKTPELSVGEFEGQLYWKINGEWLLKDGEKVLATGEKGDAVFAKNGIKVSSDNVTFTLADGTKITLPLTKGIAIGFDSYEEFVVTSRKNIVKLVLPNNLEPQGYMALKAEVTNNFGVSIDIKTRAAASTWKVEVKEPRFDWVDEFIPGSAGVKLIPPTGASDGEVALLKVTIVDNKGNESSSTRVVKYSSVISSTYEVGDLYPDLENPCGIVFWVDPSDATKGKIVSLKKADLAWGAVGETGANDVNDGAVNMQTVKTFAEGDLSKYPAFEWCDKLEKVNGYSWYMPALNEVKLFTDSDVADLLNDNIISYDSDLPQIGGNIWVSNEENANYALTVYGGYSAGTTYKTSTVGVRAVLVFDGGVSHNYVCGDLYPDATNPVGVVVAVDEDNPAHGKILSLQKTVLTWGPDKFVNQTGDDGVYNMERLMIFTGGDLSDYPAFAWCNNLPKIDGNSWYLPGAQELMDVIGAGSPESRTLVDNAMKSYDSDLTIMEKHWASTENDQFTAYAVTEQGYQNWSVFKSDENAVRAMLRY